MIENEMEGDSQQKRFLDKKFLDAKKGQPEWVSLKKKLLSLGGDLVVADYEEDLFNILKRGILWNKTDKYVSGMTSQCHHNTANLYMKEKIDQIVTGYALSSDGLWRQHSWGLLKNKTVETTERRIKYFGFVLDEEESEEFLEYNL